MKSVDPVRATLLAAIDAGIFPGAVVHVRRRGQVWCEVAVGSTAYPPIGKPVTPSTLYDLASLTKPLATTTAVLQLVQDEALRLEDPVARHLHELHHTAIGEATIWHLLTHSSGLPGWRPFYQQLGQDVDMSEPVVGARSNAERVLSFIRSERLEFVPGERSLYSDLGFMLLGWIVERLSGCLLDEFCRSRLYSPIGAWPLAFVPRGMSVANLFGQESVVAPTEEDPWRGRLLEGEVHDENAAALGAVAGHAGLFGTAQAVACVAQAWLDAWSGQPGRWSSDLVRRFVARQTVIPSSTWALGWDTPSGCASSAGTHFSTRSFGHLGFTGTSIWIDPAEQLVVVLLSNRVHPTRRNDGIKAFRPKIHDVIWEVCVAGR
jgi:CubicO group peptidase (beta-lactamase class C family)